MLVDCQTKHAVNWCTYKHQWTMTQSAVAGMASRNPLMPPYVLVEQQILS